ncbi:oligosaccharide flippase family protein [Clostridium sp.]|uniref:oligosaccharide flippase family protein n=1 Tax=Clostridium sp. TaxID=1506 RepID=UPI001A53FD4D|nr:oligosaccharide flippase family protein [Clostridium sp.]MBK5240998.1 oligosaccharide flippase family protein [Clostridium sp.]
MRAKVQKISEIDGGSRSKNVKTNISLSFIFKTISIGISYLLIPMTISYLNSEQYGVWMTLLAIISWMSFFDIGLGNGLRNKLTESLSKNDIKSAKEYVSTAYAAISAIVIFIFIVLMIIIPSLNWNKIFNTNTLNNSVFIELVIIVVCFFLFNFVLSLCNQLFHAVQESAFTGIGMLLMNLFSLINLLILKQISSGDLVYIGISYGLAMVTSSMILTTYFFIRHKNLLPELKLVRKNRVKDILGIGIRFFIIQIAVVVIFTTDNMIITQVLGPAEVTSYNIAKKLFSAVIVGHTIIVTPLWSAYTEAYLKGDIAWIKKLLKKLNLLMIPIVICVGILALLSDKILKVWIGDSIIFPKYLIGCMALYTLISVWNNIYSYFLNGAGFLNLSMYVSIIAAIANIPLSIYFSENMNLGNPGVILGTICCLLPGVILGPIQTIYVLNKKEGEKTNGFFS